MKKIASFIAKRRRRGLVGLSMGALVVVVYWFGRGPDDEVLEKSFIGPWVREMPYTRPDGQVRFIAMHLWSDHRKSLSFRTMDGKSAETYDVASQRWCV